ncbi:MAG: bifunctional 4-hydroxy-3-methylbut-2-enyl diphosphate reductase/30S ribosomal protein S1 [Eubacteriaceae bacterium]|nr:bifunctional 4-hydroxy-3-methylbut-2-enyl diphosphate reductase/30S ribosomal protein S1 [Eubacteriaceae bacterium]
MILAKSAGFCVGVARAVKLAENTAEKSLPGSKIFTVGELIHNPIVTERLSSLGISAASGIQAISEGTVIIRSHGISKAGYEMLRTKGLEYVDATCAYVKSIQNTVEKYHKKGYTIVIIGDKDHPEVIGVNGWCEDSAHIVSNSAQAQMLSANPPLCIVAQTTFIRSQFNEICDIINQRYEGSEVFETICSATEARQAEAGAISKTVDAMLVIGGKNSSNTKKLVEICQNNCKQVFHIETAADIKFEQFRACETLGITAGASTPEKSILEVLSVMDNTMENFEKSIDNLVQLKTGDIVTGEIISVNEQEIYVNIGYKSDGIIKKSDYVLDLYSDLPSIAAIGDSVTAMIVEMNDGTGNISLSKIKVDEIEAYNLAEEKYKSGESIEAKITKIVKGGVIVDLGFTTGFMPGNQYALRYTEDLNVLLGKDVTGRIIEFDKEKNKIIFSRKIILQEERARQREEKERLRNEAIESLELEQVLTAPIKNITDFGIFLDLGGVDGFIHVSDLSWRRVPNPKSFCSVGEVIEAKIIELDKESFKVKLSIKALTQEPWIQFSENYNVGDKADVKIKSIVKFGAFAEILPGVEGLIHISNLAHEKVASAESVVAVGEEITVKIIDIDQEKRKIGLSLKDMTSPPKRRIESEKIFHREDSSVTMEDLFKKYQDNNK